MRYDKNWLNMVNKDANIILYSRFFTPLKMSHLKWKEPNYYKVLSKNEMQHQNNLHIGWIHYNISLPHLLNKITLWGATKPNSGEYKLFF